MDDPKSDNNVDHLLIQTGRFYINLIFLRTSCFFFRVDFDEFPALANVDYHIANLTSGDCLFVPSNWIFQERSFENTISVVYNIKHRQALNIDVSELKTCPTYDATFTLDQIDWSAERQPQSFK